MDIVPVSWRVVVLDSVLDDEPLKTWINPTDCLAACPELGAEMESEDSYLERRREEETEKLREGGKGEWEVETKVNCRRETSVVVDQRRAFV